MSTAAQSFVERWRSDPSHARLRLWSVLDRPEGLGFTLVAAELFVPRLIEVDGHVLLAENYDPAIFAKWRERSGGNISLVEEMMNLVNLSDLFMNDPTASLAELDELAERLHDYWQAALTRGFPGREFLVQVVSSAENEDGPEITFYSSA